MQKAILTAFLLLCATTFKAQDISVSPMYVATIVGDVLSRMEKQTHGPTSGSQSRCGGIANPESNTGLRTTAIRANLLYGIATLTPNLGVEIALANHSTVLVTSGFNGWNLNDEDKGKMLCHWLSGIEYRYWLRERFDGHFFGVHGYYANFHIKGYGVPLMLEKGAERYRYKGNVYGAGLSYGYQLGLGLHWNIEFNAGVGFGIAKYDKYNCDRCSDKIDKDVSRAFLAPTKLGISLLYFIELRK